VAKTETGSRFPTLWSRFWNWRHCSFRDHRMSGVAKRETWSRFATLWLLSWKWHHNPFGDHPIWIKFGTLMQNHMPTMVKKSFIHSFIYLLIKHL